MPLRLYKSTLRDNLFDMAWPTVEVGGFSQLENCLVKDMPVWELVVSRTVGVFWRAITFRCHPILEHVLNLDEYGVQ